MKTFCLAYLVHFFIEGEPFETVCREIQDTYFISNNFFFSENRAVCEKMWHNIVEPGGPHNNVAHAHACWITEAIHTHTHTLRICNTYCLSTATFVARLYLHCQSSLNICFQYLGQTIIYCCVWRVAKCCLMRSESGVAVIYVYNRNNCVIIKKNVCVK